MRIFPQCRYLDITITLLGSGYMPVNIELTFRSEGRQSPSAGLSLCRADRP